MVATDIDETSFEYARKNVAQNWLDDRIQLFLIGGEGALIPEKLFAEASM